MPPWFAEEMAAGIAGAQLLRLASGGHMLLETRGEAVVRAALDLFTG